MRELRDVRKLLDGELGDKSQAAGMHFLRLCIDNTGVAAATRSFCSASRPMMRELRLLKRVLDRRKLRIRPEWLPSAANRFADLLLRKFPSGDAAIRKELVHSVVAGLELPPGVLKYPRSLGENPVYARRHAYAELRRLWSSKRIQVLYPPPDLAGSTVRKFRLTRAQAILLLPDWPAMAWAHAAHSLCRARDSYPVGPPGTAAFKGHATVNPAWGVRLYLANWPVGNGTRH